MQLFVSTNGGEIKNRSTCIHYITFTILSVFIGYYVLCSKMNFFLPLLVTPLPPPPRKYELACGRCALCTASLADFNAIGIIAFPAPLAKLGLLPG